MHDDMPGTDGSKLTVAITGPTGSIGKALVNVLEKDDTIASIVGMARRPFDPGRFGWHKFEYREGDITDRQAVRELIEGADVVAHLAFIILGKPDEAHAVNVNGSRNVFEECFAAGIDRLVYTSSVAAYGFHEDNPELLDEEVPPRGSEDHYYSAQKAEVESLLYRLMQGQKTEVFIFRPCIVAGPNATELIEEIPFVRVGDKMPERVRAVATSIPLLRPVLPDPGIPFQLIHEEDVADALALAIKGGVVPGAYNLAAEGDVTVSDLAHALGWYAIPVPEIAIDATAKIVSRLPYLPAKASWINAVRVPVLMKTDKARRNLGWHPRYSALETLAETIQGARDKGLIARP